MWVGLTAVRQSWIFPQSDRGREIPALASSLPRPPAGTAAEDVLPWELRLGDVVPFNDGIGRPVVDIRAVGRGQRAKHLMFADLPPLTVHWSLRVYRSCNRLSA